MAANGCSSTSGGIVVYVMQPAIRSYYSLEELWGGKARSVRKALAASA